jgi:hypothetical protein
MILLQATMGIVFVPIILFIVLTIVFAIIFTLFNLLQKWVYPMNQMPIPWYWIIVLPTIIVGLVIACFLLLPESLFTLT